MEPISTAIAAVSAIKAGVQMGKDIGLMTREIGQLWNSIDKVKDDHNKKKSSMFTTVEEEALATFTAKKQAEDLENQLREIVIATRGFNGWQELIKLRTEIRKKRQDEAKEKARKRRQTLEIIAGSIVIIFGLGGLILFAMWLIARHEAG
ncbi:MAG: hypothetical protein VXB01_13465 [Opitutae bacterium]|jgi:hypothetical protein